MNYPDQVVRFPDIDNLHRLFRIGPEYRPTSPNNILPRQAGGKRIHPSLRCRLASGEYRFFAAYPRKNVCDVVEAMLNVDGDTIGFELLERSDGTALVTAYYNQILGSRWLAVVDPHNLLDDRLRAKWTACEEEPVTVEALGACCHVSIGSRQHCAETGARGAPMKHLLNHIGGCGAEGRPTRLAAPAELSRLAEPLFTNNAVSSRPPR